MTRLHAIAGSVLIVAILAGLVYLGSGGAGLTAITAVLVLAASQAFVSTLANLLAGIQLRSEGHVRKGVYLEASAPRGAIVGTVDHVGARLTLLHTAEGGKLLEPNSNLASAVLYFPPPTQPKDTECKQPSSASAQSR